MRLVFLVCLLVGFTLANDYQVIHHRGRIPSYYEEVPVTRNSEWETTPVTFHITLKQRNLDVLDDLFWRISNPKDSMYGKHKTAKEIRDLVSPPESDREAVLTWVQSVYKQVSQGEDIFQLEDRGDSLKITTSVRVTESLFRTTLSSFRRTKGPNQKHLWIKFIDTLSIPTELVSIVDIITGIVKFNPIPQGVRVSEADEGSCNVPYTMKLMYSVDLTLNATNQQGASQAPYSEQGIKKEGFGADDVLQFQSENNLINDPITNIIGNDVVNYIESDTDTEAALDTQMLTGFGNGANTSFWVMNEWMYEFAAEILNTEDPPLVNSMSYGWYEDQQCSVDGMCSKGETDEDYVDRTNTEFQKLGTMGITMIASSGDDGTEPDRGCDEMRPDFPASSVYVLSVGATAVVNNGTTYPLGSNAPPSCSDRSCDCSTSRYEETAMKTNNAHFDTGGGFSQYLPQPSYQTDVVEAYLNSGVALPSTQYWNPKNRGYPDVTAVGAEVLIIKNGSPIKVGGTSASCPIWGGLISLLNADRLNAGKSPLGFVNPMFYQLYAEQPQAFRDITVGTNGGGCDNLAFQATTGWDPLSGLGSPNFDKIRAYVATLP